MGLQTYIYKPEIPYDTCAFQITMSFKSFNDTCKQENELLDNNVKWLRSGNDSNTYFLAQMR